MRTPWLGLVVVALTLGCGAAVTGANEPGASACHRATAEASSAWRDAADRAEAWAGAEVGAPSAAERVLVRIEEHLAALERAPREVSGEEAFSLSSAIMDAIDGVGAGVPVALRDRADDAAEALLTDRSEQGAPRAARHALDVLGELVEAAEPGSAAERASRRALSAFVHRARDAAEGYREAPAAGDQRADRAEAAALPEAAPEVLRETRARAIAASTRVRADCAIERRISVPTL